MRAYVRSVSPRLAECQLTHLERVPIDAARAAEQHAAYVRALAAAGFDIVALPDLPDDPDAVFVEDTALVLDGHAVITRPGAPSRIGEVDSTASGLAGDFEIHRIDRGFLDGGDVLRIGRTLYVGLSSRTDRAGLDCLAEIASPLGFATVEARLRDCLHLKTGATFAGPDGNGVPILVCNPAAVDPAQFAGVEAVAVDESEPAAANVVWASETVVMPAGNPRAAERLRDRGMQVVEVDVSELQKAESGVTCMSLIDPRD